MGYYNWEEIFKKKTDNELLSIYAGNSHLDFEGCIYAGLELRKRGFDFQKIKKIHDRKIAELKMEIEVHGSISFYRTKYFRNLFFNSIAVASILIAAIFKTNDFHFQNDFQKYKFWIIFSLSVVSIFTVRWSYKRNLRKRSESILRRIELLRLLDLPIE